MRPASSAATQGGHDVQADEADHKPATIISAERFAELYAEHRASLFAFCLNRTHDPALAEDAVQDVFERAFAKRSRYDPTRPFWPWIASIAARHCINLHRRRTYAHSRLPDLAPLQSAGEDPTSETVVSQVAAARLERAIASLPVRQRVALNLFAVDGWSYSEIAAHLGAPVNTVKSLILRARRAVRETGARTLAGVACGTRAAYRRLQALAPHVQIGSALWDGGLRASLQDFLARGGAAYLVIAMATGTVVTPHPTAQKTASEGTSARASSTDPAITVPDDHPIPGGTGSLVNVHVPSSEPAGRVWVGAAERGVHDAAVSLLYQPPGHESPDGASGWSVAVSPSYRQDRTVFVAGDRARLGEAVQLLVTHDGGASWSSLAPTGLTRAARLFLPPAYPHDHRVFALSEQTLRVSRDGGHRFETLPAPSDIWKVSMSPGFNSGDPTMLLSAGGGLFEHRDDSMLIRPLALGPQLAGHLVLDAQHAPSYASDGTILVGTRAPSADGIGTWIHRCRREAPLLPAPPLAEVIELRCDGRGIARNGNLPLFIAPGGANSGMLYIGGGPSLYVSNDNGRTFRDLPDLPPGFIYDLQVMPGTRGLSAVIATENWSYNRTADWASFPALARTDDGGRSWTSLPLGPAFRQLRGTRAVGLTPTGRIIAVGFAGVICSEDGGTTWGRTCPTPDSG